MRKILVVGATLCLAATAIAGGSGYSPVAHAGSGNGGEFIIRCLMTGEVRSVDPIMAPGGTAPHVHMFFGNTSVLPTSTAAGLRTHTTTCQDSNDTAAYWAPEGFFGGAPYLPGCTPATGGDYTCGTDPNTTIYVRAYYLTSAGPNTGELPPGLIMVAGTPDATAPPANQRVVYWDCGANPAVQTPESLWPYDCGPFRDDPNFTDQEGLTEIISFPSCWDGKKSFTTPNGTTKVPGYFDPSMNMGTSDLAYPPCGGNYPDPVPHLSLRIHYVNMYSVSDDAHGVFPSSCAQASGLSEPCETQAQEGLSTPPDDIGLQLSATQTGGAPGPWYTEHADYWQTWQQGSSPPSANSAPGTLNSLTYQCLDLAITCGFVSDGHYPG